MSIPPSPSSQPGASKAASVEFTDLDLLSGMLHLVVGAPRRHLGLAAFVAMLTIALSIAGGIFMPRKYVAESRIIAQRNEVIPNLGNPSRPIPSSADAPNRGAEETIFTQDNLIAVAKDVNLVDRWATSRAGIMRVKDAVMEAIAGPMSEEDMLRAMVGVLEKRIRVRTRGQAIVLSVEWSDPQMAYEVLYSVHKRFIDTRFAAEVANISDAIAILQATAKKENENVIAAVEELKRLRARQQTVEQRPAAESAGTARRIWASPSPLPSEPDETAADLERALEQKRAAIQAASRNHQNRLNGLRAERSELRTTYASAHPLVIAIERKIAAAEAEPRELASLRNEERLLLSQIAQREAERAKRPRAQRLRSRVVVDSNSAATATSPPPGPPPQDDVAYRVAVQKLETASHEYNRLRDRIRGAEIELETSRAAFKYKYRVAMAPEVPRKPQKPIAAFIIGGGLVLALVLALFLCTVADLVSGRLIQVWQIRHHLRIPVLGEVDALDAPDALDALDALDAPDLSPSRPDNATGLESTSSS